LQDATLYLHFPCFDGLISAVLASHIMEIRGWKITSFCPVNYDLRPVWLATKLNTPCAVVDFLYHPQPEVWVDHHSTTFLSPQVRAEYEDRKSLWISYDSAADSCARVLWTNFSSWFDLNRTHYQEMVLWADKIDSARYADVREAILGDSPGLRINSSLIIRSDAKFCNFLIRSLRRMDLARVAQLPEVKSRSEEARSLIEEGLKRFPAHARLEYRDIVVFDLEASPNDIVSRYAPFYFFPDARYSIGVTRRGENAKITAMRNPWSQFESVPLGTIFQRYGGGGHQRVASVVLPKSELNRAAVTLNELLLEIQREDSASSEHIRTTSARS
jgi:hypothetical protein